MIHQHTGQGLAFMTDGIREVRSLKWEGGRVGIKWLVLLSRLIFFSFSSQETSF